MYGVHRVGSSDLAKFDIFKNCFVFIFFFFKQKTAYEIKECDWSSDVCSSDLYTEDEILGTAAALDTNSEHPIATAIVKGAKEKNLKLRVINNFESVTGKGVKGLLDNKQVGIGNQKLMEEFKIKISESVESFVEGLQETGQTVMYLLVDDNIEGVVSITDPIKESSVQAVKNLKKSGVKVIMLTGDNYRTAKTVAEELQLDGFKADCLPEDKYKTVKEYQDEGKIVAMAGDGINDAPGLAQANIGIAMGTGTDVAMQSAEITLVKGDLNGIMRARDISVKVMRNIKQNLFFAFIYNILGVPVAAGLLFPFFGILLSPMLAALAMSFSSVSVIANALRLRKQ